MFYPYGKGLQHFHSTGPRPLLWSRLRAAVGKTALSCTSNCINQCVIFIVCTQFTNVATGRRWGPMRYGVGPGSTPIRKTGSVLTILWVLSGAIAVISKCLWWELRPARSESRDPLSSCLSLTLIIFGTFATNDKRRDSFRPSFVRRDAPANVLPTPVSMVPDDNHGNTINDFPFNGENFRNDPYILTHTSSQGRQTQIPTKTNSFSAVHTDYKITLNILLTLHPYTVKFFSIYRHEGKPNYKYPFPF